MSFIPAMTPAQYNHSLVFQVGPRLYLPWATTQQLSARAHGRMAESNSHQKEPASVFATYWNSLSSTDKEVYKRRAALQLNSAGTTEGSGASDDADEE
ncbi:hypothetical protein EDB19DRAFT_2046776 [Suillus lakei]|nr:hypothetical protein EDB19DRAFT_2046776 [Suillus lakei]